MTRPWKPGATQAGALTLLTMTLPAVVSTTGTPSDSALTSSACRLEGRSGTRAATVTPSAVAASSDSGSSRLRSFGFASRTWPYVDREAHVLGAETLLLGVEFSGGREGSELPGKEVRGDRGQGDEENDGSEAHQQVGDDQAVANAPQQAAKGPAPEQDDRENCKRDAEYKKKRIGRAAPPDVEGAQRDEQENDCTKPEGGSGDEAGRRIAARQSRDGVLCLAQVAGHLDVSVSA